LTAFERRSQLLSVLREQPGIRVPDLSSLLDVSEGTIRNDLRTLSASGQLKRVWGGGIPLKESEISPSYSARVVMNRPTKAVIARMAAKLVKDGDSLLLDASTSVFHMAYFLKERHHLTIITNGIDVGRELARDTSNTVIMLGGILRSDGSAIIRPTHDHLLKELHIKTAFVSSSGFSLEAGLTEVDFQEAQFKSTMIASAGKLVALIDSSKFGKVDFTHFARIEQVSNIFTDSGLSNEWRNMLSEANVPFTVCHESEEA